MYESYKSFSLEDKMWNQSFYDASKNRDKKKIFELLSKAGNVYLDEYSIDHSIFELYNANLSTEKKEKVTTPSEENGVKNDETQNGEHVVTIEENLEKLNKMTSDIHTVEEFNNFVERLKLERENENITDEEMADLIAKARTNMEPETTPVQEVNDETTTDTTNEEKVEDVVNNDKPVQTPTTKGKQEITPDVRMALVERIQNAKEVSDIREIQRTIRQYKRFPGRKNLRRAYKAKLREIRHQDKAEAKAKKYEDKFNERMEKIMSSDIYKNDQSQLKLKKPKGNSIFG